MTEVAYRSVLQHWDAVPAFATATEEAAFWDAHVVDAVYATSSLPGASNVDDDLEGLLEFDD